MMIQVRYILMLVLLPLFVGAQEKIVVLQEGFRPVIDGRIIQEEWSRAHKLPLSGGEFVWFQVYEDTVYIAVKGASGGFCSLAIGDSAAIWILHSSTNLITAAYEKPDSAWVQKHGFERVSINKEDYPQNIMGYISDYRKMNLDRFGWYANLLEMGEATDTEYQIPLTMTPGDAFYVSVVFFQASASIQKALLPADLDDGCIDRELVSGSAGEYLEFQPESWIRLVR